MAASAAKNCRRVVVLAVHDMSVRAGDKILLSEISLNVLPGEVLAVVGPNGAGKSTLLKALCGELSMHCGQIVMNGRNLADWSLREQACLRSVLPQNSTLVFPFSVLDVVLLGRSPHSGTRNTSHDESIARKALALTDAGVLRERLYTTLSGGERQRVQLARVLAQIWEPATSEARYLLLDEPTSALDLAHQHATLTTARHFAESQNIGVFVILHDLNLAAGYADRIAVLDGGRLKAQGSPCEVLEPGLIHEVFRVPVTVTRHPQKQNQVLIIDCPHQALGEFA